MRSTGVLTVLFLIMAAAVPARAVVPGQVDDFEGGTTMGWREGASSPNPPTVATGGPGGALDHYLRAVSSGGVNAGSRMVFFNQGSWRGNYNGSEKIVAIRADMANLGAPVLNMRVGVEASGCRFVSTTPAVLPANDQWTLVEFDLSQMTQVGGTCTLEDLLDGVGTLRILSSAAPSWLGDSISAIVGVDNITAVAEGVAVAPATWSLIKERYR